MAENQTNGFSSRLQKIVWLAFLILVFSLAFMKPFIYLWNQRVSPTDIIFPIAFLIWFASLFAGLKGFRWHKFYWILLFYFVSLIISTIFSNNPASSLIKLFGESYLLGLAVLTFNLVETERQVKQTIKIWLAGTFFACAVGVYSLILFYLQPGNPLLNYTTYHYGAVPVGNYPRLSSMFVSASMFCNYLNVGFLLLLIARKIDFINKHAAFILLTVVSICAVFTISAGLGGFALASGLWLYFLFGEKHKRLAALSLIGGITVSALFFMMNFVALQKHATARFLIKIPIFDLELQPSPRVLIWQESLQTFSQNFFSGVGLGEDVCRVSFQNTEGTTSVLTDAHNYLLNVAAQNGIAGLIAIVVLTIFIIRRAFPAQSVKSSSSTILIGLTMAFFCSFFYQGLTGSFEEARHLWVLIGLILSADRLSNKHFTI
jgi:O-antigen ligase